MPERADGLAQGKAGPRILAIAGGSCSGKTTLSDQVIAVLGPARSTIIRTDNYYRADIVAAAGDGPANFDLPTGLDVDLLHANLLDLKRGNAVEGPLWDFVTHRRCTRTLRYEPNEVVVVEGIFALFARQLTALYDHSCFIECPQDVRLRRRIVRDVAGRGRTERSVHEQFHAQVVPMHDAFVEPTKHMAQRIISQSEYCASPGLIVEELLSIVTGQTFKTLPPGDA